MEDKVPSDTCLVFSFSECLTMHRAKNNILCKGFLSSFVVVEMMVISLRVWIMALEG
jgi:hypothetical protein